MIITTLVYSIHDSTEEAIKKMIESSERIVGEQNNTALNRHLKLEIKTLQNAPRDADKLERLFKAKKGKRSRQQKKTLQPGTQNSISKG
jgi:hypothetical protein